MPHTFAVGDRYSLKMSREIAVQLGMVVLIFLGSAMPALAHSKPLFTIPGVRNACYQATITTDEFRACVARRLRTAIKSMNNNMFCSMETCLVYLACDQDKWCNDKDYAVHYKPARDGFDIEVTLAEGQTGRYFQCGNCNLLVPNTDNDLPVEILRGDKAVILEFPSSMAPGRR
ncbi:hypothetical protein [Mesorhizobium sp. NPDC059025]|uniref:hypothetical protein n=1 Tax=unclassified Mesorhizobium TaxID=325217 RepID=UPI0036C6084C